MTKLDGGAGVGARVVTIDSGSDGQRLDNFLVRELKGVPKGKIYKIIRKGEVRVNKGRCKPETKLKDGDQVRIPPIRVSESDNSEPVIPAGLIELVSQSTLFENDELLIINKPCGVAVHGGSGVSFGVIEILRAARQDLRFLELAHRLDRDTSGVLVLAKKRRALVQFHDMLKTGRVEKIYHAWVCGKWPKHKSVITAPLKKNVLRSGERVVSVSEDGKASETRFRVLYSGTGRSLVEAQPITGRTHQIRVHAKFAGHPIIGDDKYCDSETNKVYRDMGVKRLCLHAYSLRLSWLDRPEQKIVCEWDEDHSPALRS
ncbi:RluA family pseudouridine synthase [Hahella sp. HN01]|uniref:RluA family pseudouridine synthase n=1 Tax=Hahella sp. HN01 TaxID=2847262 RepID=UPI001C1E91C7|nr:RluA family pseudouridine synthase [Hahella sp. HN01]